VSSVTFLRQILESCAKRAWLPRIRFAWIASPASGPSGDYSARRGAQVYRSARRDRPLLAAGQDESYFQPHVSAQHGTLFEHCACALDRSLAVGSHGLPLIGTGDWNDGGERGRSGQEGRERLARLVMVGNIPTVMARANRGAFRPRRQGGMAELRLQQRAHLARMAC
jgi:hypothetical protein